MSEFTDAVEAIPDMAEEDWANVTLALARGADEDGFTEEDMTKLSEWVSKTLIDFTLLGMLTKGVLDIMWNDEDWSFRLSDEGERVAEELWSQLESSLEDE